MQGIDDYTAKHSTLSIWLAPDGFSFLVQNNTNHQIHTWEQKSCAPHQDSIALAIKTLDEHQYQKQTFRAIHVLLDFPEVTSIPSALYDEDHKETAFAYHHDLTPKEYVVNNHCAAFGLEILFTIPIQLYEYFGKHYKNYRFIHRLSALLEQANKKSEQAKEQLFIAYTKEHFVAVGIRNHGLIYHNAFTLNSDEDLIYYLLLVFQELQFDQYQAQVHLSGPIEKDHPSIAIIKEYVQYIEFAQASNKTPSSNLIKQEQIHFITPLLELQLCE